MWGDGLHFENTSKGCRGVGIRDGDLANVETEAGSAKVEAEVTNSSHRGQVVIPHGFRACPRRRGTWSQCEPIGSGKTPRPLCRHAAAPLCPLPGAQGIVSSLGTAETSAFRRSDD